MEVRRRAGAVEALLAFGVFGAYWGAWGASIPSIQRHAGVDDRGLGLALLGVGAGGLPAMLLTGRLVDRYGLRMLGLALPAMGLAGLATAVAGRDALSLAVALAAVGATSGACDVANNAVAGRAETATGRPVITRAHGTFSAMVVLAGVLAGVGAAASLPTWAPFAVVAAASLAVGGRLFRTLPRRVEAPDRSPAVTAPSDRAGRLGPLVVVGLIGALALASENAHQNWSAVYASHELGAGTALAAGAPALFAAVVALARFSAGRVRGHSPALVLGFGGTTAAVGAAVLAAAPDLAVAAIGLGVAAAGTAVLFPTVMRVVSQAAAEHHRGRATSVVAGVSYLGFLVGPVYVGFWADAAGLRGAMGAVAALGLLLALVAPPLLRRSAPAAVDA